MNTKFLRLMRKAVIVFIAVFLLVGLCAVTITVILSLNDTRRTDAEIEKINRNEPVRIINEYNYDKGGE